MALTNTHDKNSLKKRLFLDAIKAKPELLAQADGSFKQMLSNIDAYVVWVEQKEDS